MITCPYCEKESDNPDDCYSQDILYQHECDHCEKAFVFRIEYDIYYHEFRADCLNGGEHDYKKTKTYPPEFARMECTMCEKQKGRT